jgi:hypothetical protein
MIRKTIAVGAVSVVLAGLIGCQQAKEKPGQESTPVATATSPATGAKATGDVVDLRPGSTREALSTPAAVEAVQPLSPPDAAPSGETTGVTETAPPPKTPVGDAQPATLLAEGGNLLADMSSPYLRDAAKSPVHWMPWGKAAFDRAARLNRPVLLSIGASWCHWCHVMDDQTYSNPGIARTINENFVAIKVDRDERPDIDERYQTAHYLINRRSGGWPLTIFALPDGRAFESLTLLAPEPRNDQPGMTDVLQQVIKVHKDRREDAVKQADLIEKGIGSPWIDTSKKADPNEKLVRSVRDAIARSFDSENGGFGRKSDPKFPSGGALMFLLHFHSDYGDKAALEMVSKSLTAYYKGGLRDNVLGGYFRYSADGKFEKSHVEKLLYVQGELLSAFSNAYAATGKKMFKDAALEILRFSADTLERREGGFHASQDADMGPDDDGSYFTWTAGEIDRIAGSGTETDVFKKYMNVAAGTENGKETRSALRSDASLQSVADSFKISYNDAQKALDSVRKKLRDARLAQDKVPYVDKTVIASWNGAMVSAYLDSYRYLGTAETRDFALKTMDFILNNMVSETEGVAHAYVKNTASVYGLLDDQVQTAAALVDCFEVAGRRDLLETAESLMGFVEAKFLDNTTGLYRDRITGEDFHGLLKVARLHVFDNPTPAANAVAAITWFRLFQATGKQEYKDRAARMVNAVAAQDDFWGPPAGTYARALALLASGSAKAVVVGDAADENLARMREAALSVFRAGKLVEVLTPAEAEKTDYPPAKDGKAIAYVCTPETCAPPVRDADKVVELLKGFGKPGAPETTGNAPEGAVSASSGENKKLF